jgi:predicted RNase H-like HicB family nuclease
MNLVRYPAVLEEAEDGTLGVWFPDFPGCVSHSKNLHGVIIQATEALALHVQGMVEDDEPIPEPTSLGALGGVAVLHCVFAVDVDVPDPTADQSQRLNVTLPMSLVVAIDRISNNRSGWLAEAAREKLRRDQLVKELAARH